MTQYHRECQALHRREKFTLYSQFRIYNSAELCPYYSPSKKTTSIQSPAGFQPCSFIIKWWGVNCMELECGLINLPHRMLGEPVGRLYQRRLYHTSLLFACTRPWRSRQAWGTCSWLPHHRSALWSGKNLSLEGKRQYISYGSQIQTWWIQTWWTAHGVQTARRSYCHEGPPHADWSYTKLFSLSLSLFPHRANSSSVLFHTG